MKYIFAVIGGSGSRYLINKLKSNYHVGDKPDAVFQPIFIPILKPVHIDSETLKYLQNILFTKRSNGFTTKGSCSLRDIFPHYIKYVQGKPYRTAVFNYAMEESLFSQFGVKDTVFKVRHPLHAYLSFVKPVRHEPLINYLGGSNSKEAIEYYCSRWNSTVKEYFRLVESGVPAHILRFEFLKEDLKSLPELENIYSEFDPSKRNISHISSENETYLKKLVSKYYFKLYDNWRI